MLEPRHGGFLFLVALLVGSCAGAADEAPTLTSQAESQPADGPAVKTPSNPIPEPVTSARPTTDPDALLGLEPREIQILLGPVSLKRWEGDAQVMQFKGDQCVMDIYFYESAPGAAFQATYLSARTTGGASADTRSCLSSLLLN